MAVYNVYTKMSYLQLHESVGNKNRFIRRNSQNKYHVGKKNST